MGTKSAKYYTLVVALFTAVMLLFIFALQSAHQSKTVAYAAPAKKYVKELKLAYGYDGTNAKENLTGSGYTVIKNNLNEDAHTTPSKYRETYLGYKTTTNRAEAITDIAMMSEDGGYSFTDYDTVIKKEYDKYSVIAEGIMVILKEFRVNYNNKSPLALLAYETLNNYLEDDSGKLLGDFFLDESLTIDELLKFATQVSQYMLNSFAEVLSGAVIEDSKNDYLQRLMNLTEAEVIEIREDKAEDKVLYDGAFKLYCQADPFKEALKRNKYIDEEVTEADVLEDEDMAIYLTLTMYPCELVKNTKVGDKTLYDIFSQREISIKDMYPLAKVMTKGQIEQVAMAGFLPLFNATKDIAQEHIDTIKAEAEPEDLAKPQVISAYFGVDRTMLNDSVAVTKSAERVMQATDDTSAMWGNISSAAEIGMAAAIGTSFFTAAVAAGIMFQGRAFVDFVKRGMSAKRAFSKAFYLIKPVKVLRAIRRCKGARGVASIGRGTVLLEGDATFAKSAMKTYGKILRFSIAGSMFYIAMAVMIIVTIVFTALEIYNFYNPEYTETPRTILDHYSKKDAEKYIRYDGVLGYNGNDNRDNEMGDLNAYTGKKWNALYTTKDPAAGRPIEASALVFDSNKKMTQKGYKAIHLFGSDGAANLNSFTYKNSRDIFLYFKEDMSVPFSASVFAQKATPYLLTILGLMVGFASAALIFTRKRKSKMLLQAPKTIDEQSKD